MTVALPDNPSTSNIEVGKDFLFYVNKGTAALPVWALVGGQRSSDLKRKRDEIDGSHKTSGGWKITKGGLASWSIDLSSLVILSDEGFAILEAAFDQNKELNIKLEYPDGTAQTGWGTLTGLDLSNAHDAEAEVSGTISGNGALTSRAPSVSPLSATMSKAAAADKVFTIVPSTTTVSSVKNGDTALTLTTHYTYSTGTLTIKSTYLSGLSIGTTTLAITTGDGAVLNVFVTITA